MRSSAAGTASQRASVPNQGAGQRGAHIDVAGTTTAFAERQVINGQNAASVPSVTCRPVVVSRLADVVASQASNSRARAKTPSSISSVNFLVLVFCWLTW